MAREPGFYWVLDRSGAIPPIQPMVAEWHVNLSGNGHWHITNFEDDIEDVGFEILSERLNPPPKHEQPKELVAVHAIDANGRWWDLRILSVLLGVVRCEINMPLSATQRAAKAEPKKAGSRARRSPA